VKPYVVALLVVVAVLGGFYGGYKVGHSNVIASTTPQGSQVARNPAGGGSGFAGTRGGGGLAAACPTPGATPSTGQALARGTISNHELADGDQPQLRRESHPRTEHHDHQAERRIYG
jgi:hypothetical protein